MNTLIASEKNWDKKLVGWKPQILSAIDKVILIKSNITGISQYCMSWYPTLVCKEIDINRNFFWNDNCKNINTDNHKLYISLRIKCVNLNVKEVSALEVRKIQMRPFC